MQNNIEDYLKYYKNLSLKDNKWNLMDNLICAILAYLPLKSFENSRSLKDCVKEVIDLKIVTKNVMMNGILAICKELVSSKRYANAKISNFVNNKGSDVSFGALTLTLDNIKVISFKGSDSSTVSWLENFRLWYQYPTLTQKLAIDYLHENISMFDTNIYIVGHSKGGNLAEVSALEMNPLYLPKLKNVVSFDGPGLRPDEFNSVKYKAIARKLICIIPSNSVVGPLMYNKTPLVIKTNALGINGHYPNNWLTYGEFFVKGTQSSLSKRIHDSSLNSFAEIKREEMMEGVEAIFDALNKQSDSVKINFKDFMEIYKNLTNIDPKVKKYIDEIMNTLISGMSNNKRND